MSDESEAAPAPKRRSTAKRLIRWGVTVAVIAVVGYFFARALIDNWGEIEANQLTFSWLWVVAIVLFAIAVPLTGIAWAQIVRTLDPRAEVSAAEAVAVQCLSWLLKYIPGQVGSVANKVVWAGKKTISRTLIVISFVYENVFLQIASIVPAVVILFLSLGPQIFGDNVTLLVLPLLVLIPLGLVLYRPVFHAIVRIPARRVLKQDVPREYFLSSGASALAMMVFLGPRILNGIGFVVLAASVVEVTPTQWLPFAAAYVLAGAIGILAVFVPSGLGVREAVIVVILSQYIPTPEAIIISLLARLLSTLADAVIALIYIGVRRSIPKEFRP